MSMPINGKEDDSNVISILLKDISEIMILVKDWIVETLKQFGKFVTTNMEAILTATNIAYVLANFIMSIMAIFSRNGKFMKFAAGVSLLGTVIQFSAAIKSHCDKFDIDYNADEALKSVHTVVQDIEFMEKQSVHSNATEYTRWIKIGIYAFVSIFMVGIGVNGFSTLKHVNEWSRTLESVKRTGGTINDITDWVLREIVDDQSDEAGLICLEYEKHISSVTEMLRKTAAECYSNKKLYDQAKELLDNNLKMMSRPDAKESARFSHLKNILTSTHTPLNTLISDVERLIADECRQPTLGVILVGEPGIGKSTLVNYLVKKINEKIGYNGLIYDMDIVRNFNKTYGNQDYGVKNELLSVIQANDPFISSVNKIFSGDPVCFEGASLSSKEAPCNLKMGFLTMNDLPSDLSCYFVGSAEDAFWSRFIIIEVTDPQKNPAGRTSEFNPHRKSDFSHLALRMLRAQRRDLNTNFEFVPWDDDNNENYITHVECLIDYLTYKLAVTETDFVTRNPQFKVESRTDMLRGIIREQAGLFPNAGRNFFTVRLQGPVNQGKTSHARALAERLSSVLQYDIANIESWDMLKPLTKPMIYILDDLLTRHMTTEQASQYVNWMNKTHANSIFIIITNCVIKPTSTFNAPLFSLKQKLYGSTATPPFDMNGYKHLDSSITRRLGLEERVWDKDGNLITINPHYARTYTYTSTGEIFSNNYQPYSVGKIMDRMYEDYRVFMKDTGSVMVLKRSPGVVQHSNLKICAQNVPLLKTIIGSTSTVVRLYYGRYAPQAVMVADDSITQTENAITPELFTCKDIGTLDDDEIAYRMAIQFMKAFPGKTFFLRLTDEKKNYYFSERVLYIYGEIENEAIEFYTYNSNNKLRYRAGNNLEFNIDPIDLAFAFETEDRSDIFRGSMDGMTISQWEVLTQLYDNFSSSNFNGFISDVEVRRARLKTRRSIIWLRRLAEFKENPLKMCFIGLLVATLVPAGLYGIYRIFKYLTTDEESEECERRSVYSDLNKLPNAFAFQESDPSARTKKREQVKTFSGVYANGFGFQESDPSSRTKKSEQRKTMHGLYANAFGNAGSEPPNATKKSKQSETLKRVRSDVVVVPNQDELDGLHEHLCDWCQCTYSHVHKMGRNGVDHEQRAFQCPNPSCPKYYGKGIGRFAEGNRTHAILLSKRNHVTPNANTFSFIETFYPALSSSIMKRAFAVDVVNLSNNDIVRYSNIIAVLGTDGSKDNYRRVVEALHDCEMRDYLITMEQEIPNMLSLSNMIPTTMSDYETLHRQLNKCYVRIEYDFGMCYALHIRNNLYITVAHGFENVGKTILMRSNDLTTSGSVVRIIRDRDIAIIHAVDDLRCPSALRYVIQGKDKPDAAGVFMRCGPEMTILVGKMQYVHHQEFNYTVGYNSNTLYEPTEYQMVMRTLTMTAIQNFVKNGDCGFPFVVKVGGSLKVVGIHNAYKVHNVVIGSTFNKEELEQWTETVIHPNAISYDGLVPIKIQGYEEGLIPALIAKELVDAQPCTRYVNDHIDFIGYSKKFDMYSKLKVKHITHHLELENPCLTLPAAVNMQYVTDTSKLAVDSMGRPDPCYTQILKYVSEPSGIDEEYFKHAERITFDEMTMEYGSYKLLSKHHIINGMENGCLAPVDQTTSPGPILRAMYGLTSKKDIFKPVHDKNGHITYDFSDLPAGQVTKTLFEQAKQACLDGKNLYSFCQDCPKVEFLAADKARAGKVRIFNVNDTYFNLLLKWAFGGLQHNVIEKHLSTSFKIGQNIYVSATHMQDAFDEIQGRTVSNDYGSYDKRLPKKLIQAFCRIARKMCRAPQLENNQLDNIFKTLDFALTHNLHVMKGNFFIVGFGNMSGTFTTTLLNCVTNKILCNYTIVRRWYEIRRFYPMATELRNHKRDVYLGDDTAKKVSHALDVTEEDFMEDSAKFGMLCEAGKGDEKDGYADAVKFCSRTFIRHPQTRVLYPALKKSSIVGLLYYFASFERDQVIQNLSFALFECALHLDREWFDSMLRDVLMICDYAGINPGDLYFSNFDSICDRFEAIAKGDGICDIISSYVRRGSDDDKSYTSKNIVPLNINKRVFVYLAQNLTENTINLLYPDKEYKRDKIDVAVYDILQKMATTVENNPIGSVLELLTKLNFEPPKTIREERTGPDHNPSWETIISFKGDQFGGTGPSKTVARKEAYSLLYKYLIRNVKTNSATKDDQTRGEDVAKEIGPKFIKYYATYFLDKAGANIDGETRIIVFTRRHLPDFYDLDDGFIKFRNGKDFYFLSPLLQTTKASKVRALLCMISGVTVTEAGEVLFDSSHKRVVWNHEEEETLTDSETESSEVVYPNTGILGAETSDKTEGIGTVTATHGSNPSATTPAVPHNNDTIVGDDALDRIENMNLACTPSMLPMGGILFDLKDMVYNQFIDCDTEYSISSDTKAGTLLFQIPYGVAGNTYINPFARTWLLMHERFTGSFIYKVLVVGVPTFSGMIGCSWSPYKINGTSVKISEMNKYSYVGENVCFPSTKQVILNDARRNDFYRLTTDAAETDTPHLVFYVYSTPQSAFGEKKTITIRIQSKLSTGTEGPGAQPLIVSNPIPTIELKDGKRALNS